MTQKEAADRLKAFLPEHSIFSQQELRKAKTVEQVYQQVDDRFCLRHPGKILYHFSIESCMKENSPRFLRTPCLCIKVSKNNHIVWFRKHLPYQGGCKDER